MGKFIVLEGIDGSGKSTQTRMLEKFLISRGLGVKRFHFPSGTGFYGEMVNSFLRGEFGNADTVDPQFAAFIFAGDRKEKAETIRKWLKEYDVVLLDRYVFSNIAYQGAKLSRKDAIDSFRKWIFDMEFNVNNIPKPDISVFLGVPMSFVNKQLEKERTGEERKYLNGCSDIHENDLMLQYRVNEQYHEMCNEYKEIVMVDCIDNEGNMLDSEMIHERLIDVLMGKRII